MRTQIDALLSRCGGVTTRARLLTVLSRNELDDEIRRGRLVAMFPRAYARPWDAEDPGLLDRAALTSVGQPAVLSHLSALRRGGVSVPPVGSVHVLVPATRHPQPIAGRLVVHRTKGRFPPLMRIAGLPVVELPHALVSSWRLLPPAQRRATVIEAVRQRRVTTAALQLAAHRADPELSSLLSLLAAGCESELEIWGLQHVFDAAGLRHGVHQKWVQTRQGRYRVDVAFERERVAVELDGAAFHGDRDQRERDLARDAALASAGWLTVRFSYARLTRDPDGCRNELLAVLASRRVAG